MTELNKPCQICDNTFFSKTKYLNKYGHLLFDGKAIFICQRCGFGQMYPKIEKNNLIEFYKNYYRSKTSPAFIDFKSSPIETTSAPEPIFFNSFSKLIFEFDFTEKHINGSIFLNVCLKKL